MTTLQANIFGQEEFLGSHTKEVERIASKYPAYLRDPGNFLYCCLQERYPEFTQLPAKAKEHLREFLKDATSIDRRRREYSENIPR